MPRKNPVVATTADDVAVETTADDVAVETTADDVAVETRFDRSLESGTLMTHITIQVGKEPLEIWINQEHVTTLQPASGG